jgi:hypothetical protein
VGGGARDPARLLIFLGVVSLVAGRLLQWSGRLPRLGRLPGGLVIHWGQWTLYLPLATCALPSVVITLLLARRWLHY